MPTIYVPVGLPGCGKSTFWAEQLPSFYGFVYSTDNYVEALAAERGLTYSDVWSEEVMDEATAWMNREFDLALKNRQDVVWDQTNLSLGKRRKILSRVPKIYEKICVHFVPPQNENEWKELRRRLDGRAGKNIPDEVIKRMMLTYVEPTAEEGFSKIVTVHMAAREPQPCPSK